MNPLYGILLAALLFAVFGAFHRRGEEHASSCGTDPQSCDKTDAPGGCSACHPIHETQESSHGRF